MAETRPGVTGENLLRLLETRLDNVVFRMGFAAAARQARQLVSHGHFAVNGRADQHPVLPGASPATGSRSASRSRKREPFKIAKETLRSRQAPDWLSVDADKLAGHVLAAAAPRPDAARAQRAARGRVLLEVAPPHDRTRDTPRSSPSRSWAPTASTRPARCRPATASPSATPCGACCSRRSRAPRSRPSRSATSTTSSARIPGVKEDVTQIVLNVKKLRLKSFAAHPVQLKLVKSGAGAVTAADITESADVEIVNPDQHLMTLDSDDVTIEMDLTVERGVGYLAAERASGCPSASSPSTRSSPRSARSTTTSRTPASAR